MTRTVEITSEMIDVDVCYGDYDGHVTRETWVVDFFILGERVDSGCYKREDYARAIAAKFIETGTIDD